MEELKMQVKLLAKGKDKNKESFILKNVSPEIANTIRRYVMNEVPTMAIEDVEFTQNTSLLYDEIVAHRLGLLPLSTDLKSYTLQEKCNCKGAGCAKCTVKMTIKGKGPCILFAGEMKSKDPKVKPLYPKTSIAKLIKKQEIELEATAMLGKGKVHTKWSPGLVYYKYKPVIEINQSEVKDANKIKDSCPVDVFKVEGDKLKINDNNLLKCHLCGACQDISDGVKLNEDESEIILYVESWGQLTVKDMVKEALDIFKDDLDEFAEAVKAAK
ncbi:MAG: DNA-directed RNA polymerase subunit D [Candidatus Woesearchaeota archaeon]|jgi:DNA-directed RNA polymerase subunit D|nr:DNA-directed RNA polymerase subunit D [Candidatus Woesearchaeota archaeon]|tara:strand:+ start:1448 stop:2260 length:813 start_codon:yes stop_codon:yes gene_type:complete